MKKFLAIVMCLAMALSMMTVVSFAAADASYYFGTATCTEGTSATLDIPFSVSSSVEVKSGGVKIKTTALPEGITLSTTSGTAMTVNPDLDLDLFNAANTKHGYVKATKLQSLNWQLNTDMQTVLPKTLIGTVHVQVADTVAAGTYTIDFTPVVKDVSGNELSSEIAVPCTIVVEAAEVNPEATIIATPTEAPNGGVVKVLQFANATEFGIKYTGSDADWAGQEFRSLATTGTIAAVEVVGLDDSFEAYAR